MAKGKDPRNSGPSLVIVESPAKARTISKFLGPRFHVEASIGHVRDLPSGAKEMPAEFKNEKWAYLGVNVDDSFAPVYVIPAGKREQVKKLKSALQNASELYLATDEDREGEAISWHLCEILRPKVPVHRLVFHEITKEAIQDALSNPRQINDGLVRAQETRRILDRLYGYEVSPLLWRKVKPKLSAGRVQSVAVRMIVEREQARREFVEATYWDLLATLETDKQQAFTATLVSVGNRKLPSGKDFDPNTGRLNDDRLLLLDKGQAEALIERLRAEKFTVAALEERPFTTRPAPPFTTSTLQQEANRKLGFTARRTMSTAQSLYENGHITYMRTDSTNLASVAIDAARDLVASEYGPQFLPPQPRYYKSKVKNAQEAHEAIRPAGHPFELPSVLRNQLSDDEFRLFQLIWKRTIASQMVDAQGRRMTLTVHAGDAVFQATGSVIDFAGFLRAYVEGSDDPEAELADKDTLLPPVKQGDHLACQKLDAKDHTTQPPARFTEASLTKALEERGIGRPSTYASIIDTILSRQYVFKRGNALVPSWMAFSVAKLMSEHLSQLVDYEFTAKMEDDLDAISRGEEDSVNYLSKFYFGNGTAGLKQQLDHKTEEIDARDTSRFLIGTPAGSSDTEAIYLRVGRYGPFLEQGERRASVPEDLAPDELRLSKAIELLENAQQIEEPIGVCPTTGRAVYIKVGRFGPYVQLAPGDDEEKPKNASLLKGMQPSDVTLEVALKLLELPRTVGDHPELKHPIIAHNGRFGPYIQCGTETRSLPAGVSPTEVTLQEAIHLLSQPRTGRRQAAKREPIRVFDPSPVTNEPVQLLDGRFGPYLTDGSTNVSLPKGTSLEELKFEDALKMLAERAAKGPPAKKASRRSGGTAKSAKKGSAPKKAAKTKKAKGAAKKTTKKKSPAAPKSNPAQI
jgi:DNA topoisomerase I